MLTDLGGTAWKLISGDTGLMLAALTWDDTVDSKRGDARTVWTRDASAGRVCITEVLLCVHKGAELLTTLADICICGEEKRRNCCDCTVGDTNCNLGTTEVFFGSAATAAADGAGSVSCAAGGGGAGSESCAAGGGGAGNGSAPSSLWLLSV